MLRPLLLAAAVLFAFNTSWGQKVRYEEQEFRFGKISVLNNQKSDGVSGFTVKVPCTLTYGKDQILQADTTYMWSRYFVFFTLKQGNSVIFAPPYSKADHIYTGTSDIYQELTLGKAGQVYNLSFFMPYHRLALSEGKHQLELFFSACNADGTVKIDSLGRDEISVQQPRLCINRMSVSDLQIPYSEDWDVAGRNIPIWNLFYKAGSDNGRGYPDIQWSIRVGLDDIYYSGVNEDAFTGKNGRAVFYTCPGDPVSLYVSDFDDFSRDDFIGTYKFQGAGSPNYQVELNALKFGKVVNAVIAYKKQSMPALIRKDIEIEDNFKMNGISGVNIRLHYAVDQASNDFPIKVTPVFTYPYGEIEIPKEVYTLGTSSFVIRADNPTGTFSFFYPYLKLQGQECPNFIFTCGDNNILVTRTFNNKELKIREFCDVKYQSPVVKETVQNGINGILLTLNQSIPEEYFQQYKEIINLRLEIYSAEFQKEIKMKPVAQQSSFFTSYSAFIPYYQLAGYRFYRPVFPLNIRRSAWVQNPAGNDLNIGMKEDVAEISIPELFKLSFNNLEIDFRRKHSQTLVFTMRHGKDTSMMNEGMIKGKTVTFSINTNLFILHPEDEIMLYLADPYNKTLVVNLMTLKAKDLIGMNGKLMKIKKREYKKLKIDFVLQKLH